MAYPQYLPRAYSPPQPAQASYPGPLQKRPRLSPNPQSPYHSPNMTNGALPNQMFSSPYSVGPSNGYARPDLETSNPQQPIGTMGPPLRPQDNRPIDVNDLSDVLAGSGVDLREEEAALFSRFSHPIQQHHETSFPPDTFNRAGYASPQPGYSTPYSNINVLSRNVPGDRHSFYGAGSFNQPAVPLQTAEERAEQERKIAIRVRAERAQYHLNDPFLNGWSLQQRFQRNIHSKQIKFNTPHDSILHPTSGRESAMYVAGPDKNEVLTVLRGQPLLRDSPTSELLTLLSLATQERLRTVVDDTSVLAKSRRNGAQGVVSPELADIALGSGNPEATTVLPTPGNSESSPMASAMKRSFSESIADPDFTDPPSPLKTIAFPNQLVPAIRKSLQSERTFEEERAAKRSKRAVNGLLSGEGARTGSFSMGTPGSGTAGLLGERAPEVEGNRKSTSKKEQRKQADAKASEAQQHVATTNTMRLALGSFGKKMPSWMTKDPPGGSAFSVPKPNSSSQSNSRVSGSGGSQTGKIKFGNFREDKEDGRGIQLRDIVMVLEPEPKEKRSLARAYDKMSSKA